ncbi:hypothetical protein BH11PAT4_BH11PAT4_0220 [soil metagenome]
MNHRQKLVVALGGIALAATAGLASHSVFAASKSDTLASSLASKLNLEESAVSTALDSVRTENEAARATEMKTKYTENLTAAVTAGKLTEAQKTLLLSKYDEVKVKQDAIRTQQETLRSETEAWAKTNNIDTDYLMGAGGKGGRGHGGPGGPGMMR